MRNGPYGTMMILLLAACTTNDPTALQLEKSASRNPSFSMHIMPLISRCTEAVFSETLDLTELSADGFVQEGNAFQKQVENTPSTTSSQTIIVSFDPERSDCTIETSLNIGTQNRVFLAIEELLIGNGFSRTQQVKSLFGSTSFMFSDGARKMQTSVYAPVQEANANQSTLISFVSVK